MNTTAGRLVSSLVCHAPAFLALSLGLFLLPARSADKPQLRPWPEYRVIMWVGDSAGKKPDKFPLFYQRLREMGVNTAMVYGSGGDPRPLLDNQFPYCVENIVNQGLCLKWNSKVSDWDAFVTAWAKTRDEPALIRPYGFDDPAWLARAKDQMRDAARRHGSHQPLAYDIRDELSVTISANPFDYDFSPTTLAGFRAWLKTRYADLPALNADWETRFASWDEVKPFTTDQIKNRMASGAALPRSQPDWQALQQLQFDPVKARTEPTRWNFSPWCDFRTYMDLSLARTLDTLRAAAHEIDPQTPVGIEGTQMPHAFGGYDLWRLSQALDWVEPYDAGNAREIFGSFMPGKPILTTVFETDTDHARRRLWHLLLEGDRGCVIWWSEDCLDWNRSDYALTPKAKALAPVLKELTSPLAQLFLRAEKQYDPIAILYSQPSIQVDWLLESTVDGSTWLRRFSSFEAEHNRMAHLRNQYLQTIQDLGYSPRFISSSQIENGELLTNDTRLLAMPTPLALSSKEIEQIRAFAEPEGRLEPGTYQQFEHDLRLLVAGRGKPPRTAVLYDGNPGDFDEHGRLRSKNPFPAPLLEDLEASGRQEAERSLVASDPSRLVMFQLWVEQCCAQVPRDVTLDARQGEMHIRPRTAIYRYRLGDARLLAFERNVDYHMSEELKQAAGNEQLEKPIDVEASLAAPAHLYDLRTKKYLGRTDRLRFQLDPWAPSLFLLSPEPRPEPDLIAYLLRQRNRP